MPTTTTDAVGRQGFLIRALNTVKSWSVEKKFIAILLAIFLVKGIVITYAHPPFSGHDEVTHFAYLQYVADDHRLPVIPDWDEWLENRRETGTENHDKIPAELWPYCEYTTPDWKTSACDNSAYPDPIYAVNFSNRPTMPSGWIYTANHPPLFYAIMTPVYWATESFSIETQLYALRLATVPMGMLVVLFAYLTISTLFPRDRFLRFLVPSFVAFQPQIAYESAMLNNDILAILFSTIVIYLLVRGLRDGFPARTSALIGLFFGLAMLSKSTSVSSAAVIAFAMIFGIGLRNWRTWLPRGLIAGGVSTILIAPWFAYMYRTYGDLTGLNRVKELQFWNYSSGKTPTIWSQLSDKEFFWRRWQESWGEFGWKLISYSTYKPYSESDSPGLYQPILWVVLIGFAGLAVWAARFYYKQWPILREDDPTERSRQVSKLESIYDLQQWQVTAIVTMALTCVLGYYSVLQFGTSFSLTQARYYFPAIVPAAILLMLGFRALLPRKTLVIGQTALFLLLVALNVYIYTAYVIPYWATAGHSIYEIDPLFLGLSFPSVGSISSGFGGVSPFQFLRQLI